MQEQKARLERFPCCIHQDESGGIQLAHLFLIETPLLLALLWVPRCSVLELFSV